MALQSAVVASFTRITGSAKRVSDSRKTSNRGHIGGYYNLSASQVGRPIVTPCTATAGSPPSACAMVGT